MLAPYTSCAGRVSIVFIIVAFPWVYTRNNVESDYISNVCDDNNMGRSFHCYNSTAGHKCIEAEKQCDGVSDCENQEDEGIPVCGCAIDEFQCSKTSCIPILNRCDGLIHCKDGRDELECEMYTCPTPTHCKCKNHRCVPCGVQCDFVDNCGDGSDELNCDYRECFPSEFKCDNLECINPGYICDKFPHCKDGSDEIHCENMSRCENGLYVTKEKVCDGWIDCLDSHHDELKWRSVH